MKFSEKELKAIHYVYKVTDKITHEYYIGSRTCYTSISEDYKYLGSMCKWNPKKENLKKEILKSDFPTREQAFIYEREMILYHTNDILNQNYNTPSLTGKMGCLPGIKNSFYGKTHSEKTIEIIKNIDKKGNKNPMWGKHHTNESKKIMSEKKKDIFNGNKNPHAKKIYQYSLNGELLNVWDCAVDCVNFYKNKIKLSRGNISSFSDRNMDESKNLRRLNLFVFSKKELNIERFKSVKWQKL